MAFTFNGLPCEAVIDPSSVGSYVSALFYYRNSDALSIDKPVNVCATVNNIPTFSFTVPIKTGTIAARRIKTPVFCLGRTWLNHVIRHVFDGNEGAASSAFAEYISDGAAPKPPPPVYQPPVITVNGIEVAVVVHDKSVRSTISESFFKDCGFSVGTPHAIGIKLHNKPRISSSMHLHVGTVRYHAPTLKLPVLCLGRDWLSLVARSQFAGDIDAVLRELPGLIAEDTVVSPTTLQPTASGSGSAASTAAPEGRFGLSSITEHPDLFPPDEPSDSPPVKEAVDLFPSNESPTAIPSIPPADLFASLGRWVVSPGTSSNQEDNAYVNTGLPTPERDTDTSRTAPGLESHSFGQGVNPADPQHEVDGESPSHPDTQRDDVASHRSSLRSYLVPTADPSQNLFSIALSKLRVAMIVHNLPVDGLSHTQCQEAFLHHLSSGTCVQNLSNPGFSPSGCYEVGHQYEGAVAMSHHAITLLLDHCSSISPEVEALLRGSLGIPTDHVLRHSLQDRRSQLRQDHGKVDLMHVVSVMHNLRKPALISLAASHAIPTARKTINELLTDLLKHFMEGECSDTSLNHLPVACALSSSSLFRKEQQEAERTPTETSVAMIMMMSKHLKHRKAVEQLSALLGITVAHGSTMNDIRRGIRRHAIQLRKAKNVPMNFATSTSQERSADAAARWPEVLTEERKDSLMDQFDEIINSLSLGRFTCACCAERKCAREKVDLSHRDIDLSVLRRPDYEEETGSPRTEEDIDVGVYDRRTVWQEDNDQYEQSFFEASTEQSDHSESERDTNSRAGDDSRDRGPAGNTPKEPPGPWLQPGYQIPDLPLDHVPGLNGLMLDPQGVTLDTSDENPNHTLTLCKGCHRVLRKRKMPRLSIANRLYMGPVPDELKELSVVEENMIARCQNSAYIVKLRGDSAFSQNGMKGHIIVYPQNPSAVLNMLPASIDDLMKPVCVVFIGKRVPTEEWLRTKAKPLLIRPSKVRAALLWLIEHNPLYRGVKVNHAVLDALPDEYMLPVHIEHVVEGRDSADPYTTGYDPSMFTVGDAEGGELDFSRVVVTDVGANASAEALKSAALRHVRYRNGGYLEVPHDRGAANEFNNPDLFPMIYPTLFPYGLGGVDDKSRPVPLGVRKHFRHIFNLSDPRFQEHRSFMFTAFNMMQRHDMLRKTSMMIKRGSFAKHAESFVDVDPVTVHIVAERIARGDSVTALNEQEAKVLKLMQEVKVVTSAVQGSAASRARMRNKIRGMMIDKGLPTFYVTINPADVYHPLVKVLSGQEMEVDSLLPLDRLEPGKVFQGRAIAKNPFLGARFFDIMMQGFIRGLLGYGSAEGGILGHVKSYFGCVEAQGRGSLHCHMLIWVEGSLNPNDLKEKLKEDTNFRERLFAYLDDAIHTEIPDAPNMEESGRFPDPCASHRTRKGRDERLFDYRSRQRSDLRRIVIRSQKHVHGETCYKYCPPGTPRVCRFELDPDKFRPATTFDVETGELTLRCLDGMVNNYNPTVVQAMRNNMDIKFIGSGGTAKAILYYITDYITKTQLRAHVAFAAVDWAVGRAGPLNRDTTSSVQHAKTLLNKCAYALLSNQELSAQQVASFLLDTGDHYSSHQFKPLFWTQFESVVEEWFPSPECYEREGDAHQDQIAMEGENTLPDSPQPAPIGEDLPREEDDDIHMEESEDKRNVEPQDDEMEVDDEEDGLMNSRGHKEDALSVNDDLDSEYECIPQDGDGQSDTHENDAEFDTRTNVDEHENDDSTSEDGGPSESVQDDEDESDRDSSYEVDLGRTHVPRAASEAPTGEEDLIRIGPGRSREGQLLAQSTQSEDYMYRAGFLHDVCLWDFTAQVEKVRDSKSKKAKSRDDDGAEDEQESSSGGSLSHSSESITDEFDVEVLNNSERQRPKGKLLEEHPQAETHVNVVKKPDHRSIPFPLGPPIPRSDKDYAKERHARLMLILFKPWRNISDLRGESKTWGDAYRLWHSVAPARIKEKIVNMQLLHECRDSRDAHYDQRRASWKRARQRMQGKTRDQLGDEAPVDDDELEAHLKLVESHKTIVASRLRDNIDQCKKFMGLSDMFSFPDRSALEGPIDDSVADKLQMLHTEDDTILESLWQDDYAEKRKGWQTAWQAGDHGSKSEDRSALTRSLPPVLNDGALYRQALNDLQSEERPAPTVVIPDTTTSNSAAHQAMNDIIAKFSLNKEQTRAFKIIAHHTLDSQSKPLRMYLGGPGGTGKSTVIKAVTEFLNAREQDRRLRLTSYTGVAARNVKGLTLHSALSLNLLRSNNCSNRVRETLSSLWSGVDYLVVDEVSMIGCGFMNDISEALTIAKGVNLPFGGISIIFAGDFAQLAPVGNARLFRDIPVSTSVTTKQQKDMFGKLLWYSVDTVVILDEICRTKDPILTSLLGRLRTGACTDADRNLLESRLVNRVMPRWNSDREKAPVIVYDNAVKDAINVEATLSFARATGRPVHWYYSSDSVSGRTLTKTEILRSLELYSGSEVNYLLGKIPLVLGMPVMLTNNFDVEGGVVNGSTGILKKIRYKVDDQGRRHATSCVVECDGLEYAQPLTSLRGNEAVALPQTSSFSVSSKHSASITITRKQIPIQPGFAITCHKSQGQTMEHVVVDLESCKGIEAAYVMVSRATSLDGLYVLRPFDERRIKCRPSQERRAEFQRHEILRLETVIAYPHSEQEHLDAKEALKRLRDDALARLKEASRRKRKDLVVTAPADGSMMEGEATTTDAERQLGDIQATLKALARVGDGHRDARSHKRKRGGRGNSGVDRAPKATMAAESFVSDSLATPLLRSRETTLYPHLETIIRGMGKAALTNLEYGRDFVKRTEGRGRNYGFADNAGRVLSSNVFGEIVGYAHGTSTGAAGTHFWGNDPDKPVLITDHTKVKHQIVIGAPSFAPRAVVDDFTDQIVVLQDIRDEDIDDERSEDGFYYVKPILKHSIPNPTDRDDPDLITLTLGQAYTVVKDDDNASKAAKGKGKEKESSPRKMKKRKASDNDDTPNDPAAEVQTIREPSLARPLPENELPGRTSIRVGAEYPPNVFPDYGGPLFRQRIARARQLDMRTEDNALFGPWDNWTVLRPGTLIMANINIVVWVIVSRNKQGKEEKKKIYHAVVKSLRVLGRSDVPVTKPVPNLSDLPPTRATEDANDDAANALSNITLAGFGALNGPPPSSSTSTVSDAADDEDYQMSYQQDNVDDNDEVVPDVVTEEAAPAAGPSKKAKKARR